MRLFRCLACLTPGLLALAWPGLSTPVQASGAVIVTAALCQNPRDAIDTLWVDRRYGAKDIFFMDALGNVTQMAGQTALNDRDAVYVVSHGSAQSIGPFPKAQFAQFFQAAHPATPATVYFDSCSAAQGQGTVLALLNEAYNNEIAALFGPAGACQLVGNGNRALEDADYMWGAHSSQPQQTQTVINNIMTVWRHGNYLDTGMTWQAACQTYVAQADLVSLNTWREAVQDKFLNASIIPIGESHNYELLIEWNTGGNAFLQCGTANASACP